MLEWVPALATVGATTVVSAMATDAWTAARSSLLAIFRGAGERRCAMIDTHLAGDLASLHATTAEDRDGVRGQLVSAWRTRLADLLEEFPEARAEFDAWAESVRRQLPAAEQSWVQTNTARDHGTVYAVQGGGTVNVHRPAPPAPAPGPGQDPA